MIYCVRYADVVAALDRAGFRSLGEFDGAEAFASGSARLSIRLPNVDGNLPEIVVNDAFDAAGLDPPRFDVFWCD